MSKIMSTDTLACFGPMCSNCGSPTDQHPCHVCGKHGRKQMPRNAVAFFKTESLFPRSKYSHGIPLADTGGVLGVEDRQPVKVAEHREVLAYAIGEGDSVFEFIREGLNLLAVDNCRVDFVILGSVAAIAFHREYSRNHKWQPDEPSSYENTHAFGVRVWM